MEGREEGGRREGGREEWREGGRSGGREGMEGHSYHIKITTTLHSETTMR